MGSNGRSQSEKERIHPNDRLTITNSYKKCQKLDKAVGKHDQKGQEIVKTTFLMR